MVTRPMAGHLELEFTSVTADDAGNYTCTSRNSVGVDEDVALLTVQCMSASYILLLFCSILLFRLQAGGDGL